MKSKIKNTWKSVWKWTKPYRAKEMIPFIIVAWIITNGWAYAFVALGPIFNQAWMTKAGAFWMAVLWLPFTPEKPLVTLPLAALLYRLFYKKKFIKKEA